jgi:hypothetical protein
LAGDGLVVSQPEECAIFIFHITRDATRQQGPRQNTIVRAAGIKDLASLLCNPFWRSAIRVRTHQAICPDSNDGLELRIGNGSHTSEEQVSDERKLLPAVGQVADAAREKLEAICPQS